MENEVWASDDIANPSSQMAGYWLMSVVLSCGTQSKSLGGVNL